MEMTARVRTLGVYGALFFAGGVVGALVCYVVVQNVDSEGARATREGGYTLVNPLLSCDIDEDNEYDGFISLKNTLASTIRTAVHDGNADRVAVYFRDMNLGRWIGVNTDELFAPASLMKVPILIAYLRDAQAHPEIMQTLLRTGSRDANRDENFQPLHPISPGTQVPAETLLQAMIRGSDNNAANVLADAIATTTFLDVFESFGAPPVEDENADEMNPKTYMRFFRILFNASYLSRSNSQRALELLSTSEFTQGLVAGVPDRTRVAHKFGERTVYTKDAGTHVLKRELHDCGIIYVGGNPYGLCVMTEGRSFDGLAKTIAELSRVTYATVETGLLSK